MLLVVFVLALFVAACGGDDDDSTADTTVGKTTTTEVDGDEDAARDDGALDDDEYADAFARSLVNSDSMALTEDEAACATDKIVDGIGAPRLQAAGMTEEYLNSSSGGPTDLTLDEARAIVDALFECSDLAASIASEIGSSFADQEMFTPEYETCVADVVRSDESIRDLMAQSLQAGGDADVPPEAGEQLVGVMMNCFDVADVFIASLEGLGTTVTDEQRQCLRDQVDANPAFRDGVLAAMAGDAGALGSDEAGAMFGEMAATCGVDLSAGG
jgi:hypothetical protein